MTDYLLNTSTCPRCSTRGLVGGQCRRCGADLSGPEGAALWEASVRAIDALRERERLINQLPVGGRVPATGIASAPVPAVAEARASVSQAAQPARESSSFSVQSVLAVAGAGLLAVAAIVFTFLNPDLTDFSTRTTIIAAITVLFLGGAWLLARRGLQFSAEAIGGLGMVFLALDIWAFSEAAPDAVSGWYFAALGALITAAAVTAIGSIALVRSWLWGGIVGLAVTPAFLGYAVGGSWAALLGHLAVGFAAVGLHELVRWREGRFGSGLKAEHVTLSIIQVLAVAVVIAQLLFVETPDDISRALSATAVLVALALLATLGSRVGMPRFWSYLAGALAASAVAVLPVALPLDDAWLIGLVPVAAAVGLVLVAVTPAGASVRRTPLYIGAWSIMLATANVALSALGIQLLAPTRPMLADEFGLATVLGLAAAAAGSWALSRLARRLEGSTLPHGALVVALWLGVGALIAFAQWGTLPLAAQIGTHLIISLALSATLAWGVAAWPFSRRLPLLLAAHLTILLAAILSWSDPDLTVLSGIAIVVAIGVAAATMPARWRMFHVGTAYAYGLLTFATALDLAGLEATAVLSLTTTLGSLGAIAATMIRRIGVREWYAVLVVTIAPFLIGVASVLIERSGWTALSTAVTFALALTLVITRRPGLNRLVRAAAAALLVPALAVVVVCLTAAYLDISGSPVALPVIAGIVAVVLPCTTLIGAALERREIAVPAARLARLAIEVTSLVTAAIAVLLSLVRVAAGVETALLVFVILGLGSTATGLIAKRRYAWGVAGASWTGALWSFLALLGVQVLEPYVLPPALAAVIIGGLLVWRGIAALPLYTVGVFVAVVPTLVALALVGGDDGSGPWRTLGLLGGAGVLVLLGAWTSGLAASSRFAALRRLTIPTLIAATVAGGGGVVQAVRLGWSLDPSGFTDRQLVMLPVLGLSLAAAGLAALAARVRSRNSASRWLYAPALTYLVAGPIAAIRPGWLAIFVVLGLALVLLGFMLATVVRARRAPTHLPPVWFTFALAWVTAVASWSERDLRVEAYSLPLGLALIAAGVIAGRAGTDARRGTITSWPVGFTGSWRLLAPGLVVTLLPSMLATGTDPRTERAILVIGLALAAILIGSLRKLAAPFILGVIVLPLENVTVFAAQIGREIGATPWWITLATAGAVLLVIAVTYERRATSDRGIAARLRDLA